jgi:ubiquinone biosynthesis protein COQ4
MSMTAETSGFVTRQPIRPLQALRAYNRLVKDKEDTKQVFEIIRALTGDSLRRAYQKMLSHEEGGRQAYLGLELCQYLDDPAWMAKFPEGSVGAEFRKFLALRGFTVEGLAMDAQAVDERVNAEHPVAWLARRIRDTHDIWHVITGYGTDAVGEACVLGFTYAQVPNPGVAFIAFGASREFRKRNPGPPYGKAIWEGYQRGKKAKSLICQDYERLLAEPLEAARKRLNITPKPIYDSNPVEARETLLLPESKLAA